MSPFTTHVLAPGEHTFWVRATDAVGNADATPAERRFAVAAPGGGGDPPGDGGGDPPGGDGDPPGGGGQQPGATGDQPSSSPLIAGDPTAGALVAGGDVAMLDRSGPALSAVRLARARRLAGRRGAAFLRLTASERAVLTLWIERAVRPRRAYRTVGRRVGHTLAAGPNVIRIAGRGLQAGRYRLRGVAVDAAGNRAALPAVRFTLR